MPTATIAVRPSRPISVGNPAVKPSTEWPTICVPSGCTPARSSSVASCTPCHVALPTRLPPTLFDTHCNVTVSSKSAIATSSSNVSSNGLSTSPSIFSFQSATSTWGTTSAVSMR